MKSLITALLALVGTAISTIKGKAKGNFDIFLASKKDALKTVTFTAKDGTVHTITNALYEVALQSEDKINGVGTILYTLLEQGNGKKATVFLKLKSLELADVIAELGDTRANALTIFAESGPADKQQSEPNLKEGAEQEVPVAEHAG